MEISVHVPANVGDSKDLHLAGIRLLRRCTVNLGLYTFSALGEARRRGGILHARIRTRHQKEEGREFLTVGSPGPNFAENTSNDAHRCTQHSTWPPKGRVSSTRRAHAPVPGETPQPHIEPGQQHGRGARNRDRNPLWRVGGKNSVLRDGVARTRLQFARD